MSIWIPIEGTAYLAILSGLAGFAAYRVGCALLPSSSDALERAWVTGMVGIVGWVALLQVLGLLGILWLPVVIGCLALITLLSLLLPRPGPLTRRAWSREAWTAIAWAAPFAVLAAVVVLSAPPGPNSFDSLHYQIPNAAHVLDTGSIRSLPFALPGESTGAGPGNGTLLLLSVMLPFHTAGLTGMVDFLCAVMAVVVTAVLGRELGRSAWTGAIAGLLLVSTVAFFVSQMRSAYDNSVALLGLVAGLTFGLRFSRTGAHRWLLLAGVSLGLAAGAKAAYLLPAAIVALAVLWIARGRRSQQSAIAFVAAILSLSAAWYLRDWVITGDPLFPEPVRFGPWSVFAGLSAAQSPPRAYEQTLVDALLGRGTSAPVWFGLTIINFGPVALAPLLSVPVMVWARGAVRAVAAIAMGCAVAYAVTPFSGSTNAVDVNAALRFLMPAALFGLVGMSAVIPDRWFRLVSAAMLGIDGVLLLIIEVRDGFVDPPLLATVAILTLAVLAAVRWRRQLRTLVSARSIRGAVSVLAAASAALAIANLQGQPDPSPLDVTLSAADNTHRPVLVMGVEDVAALLGPDLDADLVAAGMGPVGAEHPIGSISELNTLIASMHPVLVVISDIANVDARLPGWRPPLGWRSLGSEDGFTVYRT